jgi:hypothetical protein
MPTENVANRLSGYLLAQILQGAHHAIVAPAGILFRHSHDQTFNFFINPRPTSSSSKSRSVKLVRDEFSVPAENRIRVRRCCQMFQSLASQPVSNLGQCCLFAFRKQQPTLDLTSEDPVLCRQILVPQQELLIDHSSDVGQHVRPKRSRASLNLIVEPGLLHSLEVSESSCARKLRDRKRSLFNAFEIFDHTTYGALREGCPLARRENSATPSKGSERPRHQECFSVACSLFEKSAEEKKIFAGRRGIIFWGIRTSFCPLVIVEGNSRWTPRPSRAHRNSNRTPRSIGTC